MNQQNAQKKPSQTSSGFTLLEMMVVLVIMGVVMGAAMMTLSHASKEHTLKKTVLTLKANLHFARQQALLQNKAVAINLKKHGFCLQRLGPEGWQDWHFNSLSCTTNPAWHLSLHPQSSDHKHTFMPLPQRLILMPDGNLKNPKQASTLTITQGATQKNIRIDALGVAT